MKNFYIIRGVSGSGKSTLAKTMSEALGASHLEADMLLYNDEGQYVWTKEGVSEAHRQTAIHLYHLMEAGTPNIILSDTSAKQKDMQKYIDLANEKDYTTTVLVVENRHGGKSIHDVSDETLAKQRDRIRSTIQL